VSRVLLATRNREKLAELQRMLGHSVQVLGLADVAVFEVGPETGATFEENAIAKAVRAARATGEIALADDSGLAVDALNGMPGVLSARWSGRHGDDTANNALLLAQIADVPADRRGAAFVCALALVVPGAPATVVRGEWRGRIRLDPAGTNGFGYDPLFVPAESDVPGGDGRSSAQLASQEKDALSHRGRAIRLILPDVRRSLVGQE
jgi:XTP/dITP diphosphohydrolase